MRSFPDAETDRFIDGCAPFEASVPDSRCQGLDLSDRRSGRVIPAAALFQKGTYGSVHLLSSSGRTGAETEQDIPGLFETDK
ncbi:MAG: hypothetical protein LUP91_14050 [Methylococcaceae bacterium]|nr:hypothetical protein [Methylococcaceae bacterium]